MIDKKLEFAFQFASAPKDVLEAATKFRAAYIRQEKANSQVDIWAQEQLQADRSVAIAQAEFNKIFNAWDALKLSQEAEEAASVVKA